MTDPREQAPSERTLTPAALDPGTIIELLGAIPDALIVSDSGGMIVLSNTRAEEMFGYETDELVGRCVDDLVPDPARGAHRASRAAYLRQPMTRLMGNSLTLSGCRKDGSVFPVDIGLAAFSSGEGHRLVVAAIRDDSERRRRSTELRSAMERLALADDRERIARDLHDTVIQDVFATALALQSIATHVEPAIAERIEELVDRQDHIMRELRTAVFGLGGSRRTSASLRDDVVGIVNESVRLLGYRPALFLSGAIDTLSDEPLRVELTASLREALANVARHAQARHVQVDLEAAEGRLRLRVTDDGVGPLTDSSYGNGLRNLRERARSLQGKCALLAGASGGAVLVWDVPLP